MAWYREVMQVSELIPYWDMYGHYWKWTHPESVLNPMQCKKPKSIGLDLLLDSQAASKAEGPEKLSSEDTFSAFAVCSRYGHVCFRSIRWQT